MSLTRLLREVRACQVCVAHLPMGARPVLRAATSARLLINCQAPGRKVHQSGIPWRDASGDLLRDWMELHGSIFYNETGVAIIPMGFCYPGAGENGGDNPPRSECATLWHERLIRHRPHLELMLLVGQYVHRRYLGLRRKGYGPQFFPLPHPSWRHVIWARKHRWFEQTVVPILREAEQKVI